MLEEESYSNTLDGDKNVSYIVEHASVYNELSVIKVDISNVNGLSKKWVLFDFNDETFFNDIQYNKLASKGKSIRLKVTDTLKFEKYLDKNSDKIIDYNDFPSLTQGNYNNQTSSQVPQVNKYMDRL